jgi:hypothetical protein
MARFDILPQKFSEAGLPDGIHIFKPKIPIWAIFEGLEMGKIGIFYGIWKILLTFGIFYGHVAIWFIFPHFCLLC